RLYRSTDDGYTWDTVKVSLDGIYSMIAQGFNNELFLAHGFGSQPPSATLIGSGCAKSTDRGATWVDLPCYGGKGFAVGVTKKGTVLFGGETLGLFRSTNGGASWDTTIHVGPGGNMAPIIISPNGTIFTCSYGENHIWFSDSVTDGKSYTNMVHPSFPMYTTANSFQWSSNGRMYVGLKGNPPNTGMYYIDGPITANSVFTPVPNLYFNVTKMHWDDDGYMLIYGSGSLAKSDSVLTAPKKTTGVKGSNPVPTEFALHQNYPNPFNPSTTLSFTVQVSGLTTLKIYDPLGREVSILVNEHLEAGAYHKRTFDASRLASGIYIARLTNGGVSQIKKMSLIK
nr:T9SS type A sorting domain-containing protein [Bacteroidota bacterium]